MLCLAKGIISRTISSQCSQKTSDNSTVLLSTLGSANPSTAIRLQPLSCFFRVAILCRLTNSPKTNVPLALESIIASSSFPLIVYLVLKTGLSLYRACMFRSSRQLLTLASPSRFLLGRLSISIVQPQVLVRLFYRIFPYILILSQLFVRYLMLFLPIMLYYQIYLDIAFPIRVAIY